MENHEYDIDSYLNAMMLPCGHIYLAVLKAAIELNLFEITGNNGSSSKGMSPFEIASKLPNKYTGADHHLDRMLQNFKQVILDEKGEVFKKIHGMSMFEYMEIDQTFKTIFHKAMAKISNMQMDDFVI
ncbi:isoliquiritigenin 2'-O-methyltransferase-like [Neltuma alba]|uniref:isoliquiritigenin 2'-O-methyltransferase-like n=1 Tax=Neltuma alba TaxID=207710 RepID=UPI0010A4F525|nr:isoliquiritigenin 2'-O-methyltransferase-like [Prosopis alba]